MIKLYYKYIGGIGMRIGQFASKFNVSIDTVRHYMDLGLIVPIKDGAHYTFNIDCDRDLESVLELKKLGFTLMEIRSLQFYKRLIKLKPIQNEKFYKDLLKTKEDEINNEVESLTTILKHIREKLYEINDDDSEIKRIIGIPLNTIHLFACPKCNGDLSLNSSEIVDNNIITGSLECKCGESLTINDGILIYNQESRTLTSEEEEEAKYFFADYVKHTPSEYFENLYKGFEWGKNKLDFDNMKGKILLELGSGTGIFLRSIYEQIPDNATYICVDKDHVLNLFLKDILQYNIYRKNIIFITADFQEIPLKDKVIDYVFDIAGTSNYMLDIKNENSAKFLLSNLVNLLKDNVILIGAYMLFKKFSISHPHIKYKFQRLFIKEYIEEGLKHTGFNIKDSKTTGYLPVGGKYENFFVEGDKVYFHMILSERCETEK